MSYNSKINYVVGTVYRHPTTNVNQFCEFLNDILTELNINHKKYFILGDMNLSTSNATLSISCQRYLNMLKTNRSTNIINLPTRFTPTTATILDHIITNENKHQIYSLVIDHDITDHYPV